MNFGEKKSVKKTTRDQFEMLVRELKKHPEMVARPAYFGPNKIKADQVWEMISLKLNSIGPPLRTVSEWKKIWADLKSRKKKSNIDLIPIREENDLLSCENLKNIDDSPESFIEESLMEQIPSPQNISDYEIEEIELEATNSIKMEFFEDSVGEVDGDSNTGDVTTVEGAVYGLGAFKMDHSIATIKTESPNEVTADMSNTRQKSASPQQSQCPTFMYSSPKNLRHSRMKNRNLTENRKTITHRPLNSESSNSNLYLLRQQLKNQTHLLESLKKCIITLADKQTAAAERQALATERQAAATERQAAAMEAVLEHFRAQKYAEQMKNSASRNSVGSNNKTLFGFQ